MKLIKFIFLLIFFVNFYTFSYQVELPDATVNIQSPGIISDYGSEGFYNTLGKTFTTYIWFFTGVVAFIVVLTAGFYLFTSKGSQEDLKKANKMLIWGLVGIFVSLFSYVFVRVLITLF